MTTKEERTYPCPRCQQPAGRQERFAVDRDTVRVIVRCAECRHRWSVIDSPSEPGTEPNPAA